MKTSSKKDKGRRLQKWVCSVISEIIGLPFGRDCPIESRGMGQSGADVRLDRAALKRFPWSIECKNQERWSIIPFIKQAKDNVSDNTDWLLILKKNRHEEVAVLDAKVFFNILKELYEYKKCCGVKK